MAGKKQLVISLIFLAILPFLGIQPAGATFVEDLQVKISARNSEIEQIKKEISQFQVQLDGLYVQGKTLSNEVSKLELTRKKLVSSLALTEKQIESTNYNISLLEIEIKNKGQEATVKKETLSEILRLISLNGESSFLEIVLANENFSDFFDDLEKLDSFQKEVGLKLDEIKDIKRSLERESEAEKAERLKLEELRRQLNDQKILIEQNKSAKSSLLAETKNRESIYKRLLAERLEKQKALEDEIRNYEDQIRIEVDPSTLPPKRSGVLSWPLDIVKITQEFGMTSFSAQNPTLYGGGGHTGVDFRASIGTPIKASSDGVVVGSGNTDTGCRGVSYGKWILIDHENNLSTLYAHLSLISVSEGQMVRRGQIIGYSGDTGYTTGPHLHFTVFASQAVKIGTMRSKVCGTNMTLPLSSRSGYLDPMNYLGD